MALSEAQLRANRENAKKSTGPRTPEGRERSRRNALRHGLAGQGAVMLPEDEALYRERLEAWTDTLRPRDAVEEYLVSRAVVRSVQLDRGTRIENARVVERVEEAERQFEIAWIEDFERVEAELRQFGRLGRSLKRRGWMTLDELKALKDRLGPFEPSDPRPDDLTALALEALPPEPAGAPAASTLPPERLALHPAPRCRPRRRASRPPRSSVAVAPAGSWPS